jgi:serine/threonine-protein kinase
MAAIEGDAKGQPPNMDALIGRTVGGRFHVTDRIARGGMACVYFATQQPLNRAVAIKVMRADSGPEAQENFRRRFLQEASMLSQLQHPNIVTLLDYGQISDLPGEHYFMAMEYLRGETLARRFRSRGRLTVAETLRLARQIGRGLREAHRRGFVHRDLKPSNIMIVPEDDQNDIVKLVDFGIGKVIAPQSAGLAGADGEDVTRVGLLLGSPRHMAPEQIRGEAIEPRTDLYGLGIVLFQALSGRVPFDGRTEVDILVAHCSTPAPKLSEACPEHFVPESLSKLIDLLLQKQASARPTIDEFLRQLASVEEEVFGALGIAGPTLSIPPPTWRAATLTSEGAALDLGTVPDHPPPAELALRLPMPEEAPPDSGSFVTPLSVAPLRRKRGRGVALALGLGLVCIAGSFAWRKRGSLPTLASAQPSGARPQAVVAAPTPQRSTFVLSIDSTPAGATVTEDGIALGRTPLNLFVDRSTVLRAPRRFLIEREGYVGYLLEQSDSSSDASVLARLTAKPAWLALPPAGSARSPVIRRSVAKLPSVAAANGLGSDSLEIRTRR